MKNYSKYLTGITALLGTMPATAQNRPNIVYIFTDQQTAQAMSCSGNRELHTPNLDRLADEGIRFTNAYCASPLSTPSRAAMFTGMTPSALGTTRNGTGFSEELRPQSLGNLLKQAGYTCGYAGKWHVPESDLPDKVYGFETLHPHRDVGLAESVIAFLERKHKQPFFVVAAFDNPHNICEYARQQNLPGGVILEEPRIEDCPGLPANFAVPPYEPSVIRWEQQQIFKTYPVTAYTPDDWRRYRNAYNRLVEHIDAEVGKILTALDRQGFSKNTLVIFSSDHGDGYGAHQWNQKSVLYDEVTNIPLLVRLPGGKNKGLVSDILVNNGTDLLPTLCDYAGAPIPAHCQGISLRPAFEKQETPQRGYIVTETLFDNAGTAGWMVRTPRYKYVLYDKGRYREQLFDMTTDRGEMVNLAVTSRYQDELQHCRELLRQWARNNGITQMLKFIPTDKTKIIP